MAANSICRIAMRRNVAHNAYCRILSARPTNGIGTYSPDRHFSLSVLHDVEEGVSDHHIRMPLTTFSEDEEMVRTAARAWANQELKPFVREMDDDCKTRPEVIQGLFDHGFMGMVGLVYYIIICYKTFLCGRLSDSWASIYESFSSRCNPYRRYQKNGVAQE